MTVVSVQNRGWKVAAPLSVCGMKGTESGSESSWRFGLNPLLQDNGRRVPLALTSWPLLL